MSRAWPQEPRCTHLRDPRGAHCRKKETWLDLLRCLSSQPRAAAQATALSLGAYHTVALMSHTRADPSDLKLYAFGRGAHHEEHSIPETMVMLCL